MGEAKWRRQRVRPTTRGPGDRFEQGWRFASTSEDGHPLAPGLRSPGGVGPAFEASCPQEVEPSSCDVRTDSSS